MNVVRYKVQRPRHRYAALIRFEPAQRKLINITTNKLLERNPCPVAFLV